MPMSAVTAPRRRTNLDGVVLRFTVLWWPNECGIELRTNCLEANESYLSANVIFST